MLKKDLKIYSWRLQQYYAYLFIISLLCTQITPCACFDDTLSTVKLYKFTHTGLKFEPKYAFLTDIAVNDISKWSTKNPESIPLTLYPRARICKPLRSPGIDSQSGGPVRQPYLTYRPARLHRLAKSIPWNRFLGSLTFTNTGSGQWVKSWNRGRLVIEF